MKDQVFVTTGTSALEKCRDKTKYPDLETLIKQLETEKTNGEKELYDELKNALAAESVKLLVNWLSSYDMKLEELPAELGSLLAMKLDGRLPNPADTTFILLHSEPVEGELCAKALAAAIAATKDMNPLMQLVKNADQVKLREIKGLQVKEKDRFTTHCLPSLLAIIQEFCGHQEFDSCPEVPDIKRYFNITGGYKALIPYAAVLAWDYCMSICYIHEKSEELIIIEKRPDEYKPMYLKIKQQTKAIGEFDYRRMGAPNGET